jgi:hypothetical protein
MDAISFEVEGDGSILPRDRGENVKTGGRFRRLDRRGAFLKPTHQVG